MPSFPTFTEVWEEYQFLADVLESARGIAIDAPEAFAFQPGDNVRRRFADAAQELDQAFTLTLFAAIEAGVRTHFDDALDRREPQWLAVRAQALHQRFEDRVRFDDILDEWKNCPSAPPKFGDAIGELKQHYRRRHWLAHGRHFADRSGRPDADPDTVRAAADAAKRLVPDFPIS